MTQLHGYEIALMLLTAVLQAGLAFRISQQPNLAKDYPSLRRFCAVNVVSLIVCTLTLRFGTQELFCYVYWFGQLIVDGLALSVTLEIFRDIFKPYEALRHFGTIMFRWIVGVIVLVSVVSAVSTGRFQLSDLINSIGMMFDRSLMILQCGIVLFLLLTNRYLGISFRQRVFGIAVGFGINASVSLLGLSITNWIPTSLIQPLGAVMNFAGIVGDVIWLVYFFMPQPDRRISDAMPESRRWEYALASVHSPAPEGLFLTSIDRTVERLLTKNNVQTQQKPKEDKHWFGD